MKLGKFNIEFHHNMKECTTTCIVQNQFNGLYNVRKVSCKHGDPFNKLIGRRLSLTKAIETLPRENRISIWEDYKKIAAYK